MRNLSWWYPLEKCPLWWVCKLIIPMENQLHLYTENKANSGEQPHAYAPVWGLAFCCCPPSSLASTQTIRINPKTPRYWHSCFSKCQSSPSSWGMNATDLPAALFPIGQSCLYFQVMINQWTLQNLSISITVSSPLLENHTSILKGGLLFVWRDRKLLTTSNFC